MIFEALKIRAVLGAADVGIEISRFDPITGRRVARNTLTLDQARKFLQRFEAALVRCEEEAKRRGL